MFRWLKKKSTPTVIDIDLDVKKLQFNLPQQWFPQQFDLAPDIAAGVWMGSICEALRDEVFQIQFCPWNAFTPGSLIVALRHQWTLSLETKVSSAIHKGLKTIKRAENMEYFCKDDLSKVE